MQTTVGCIIAASVLQWLIFYGSPPDLMGRELLSGVLITFLVAAPVTLYVGFQKEKLIYYGGEMSRIARTDHLTGVANRVAFFEHIDKLLTAGRGPVGLVLIDLDGFKQVNDTFGHRAGDDVLIEAARRMELCLPKHTLLARLGGDEFGAVMEDCHSNERCLALGRRFSDVLSGPFQVTGGEARVTATSGIAIGKPGETAARELYDQADFALYSGKAGSRGEPVAYSGEHHGKMQYNRAVERELQKADLEREIVMHYQPILSLATGEMAAVEALARWTNGALGSVPPSVFIPAAERLGLVSKFTDIAFRKVLADMQHMPSTLRASFNLSAVDLMSPNLMLKLIAVLERSGLAASRLFFEVTESASANDTQTAVRSLKLLRAAGAKLAIDDFGTGYSNLSRLHVGGWNTIKLDRSVVEDVATKAEKAAIVRALLAFAAEFGISVVAEGIETAEDRDRLTALGVDYGQGYHFARPMPLEALLTWKAAA